MKKITISVIALIGVVSLQAQEAKETALASGGVVSGQIKAMHIISDKDNGFTPEEGSGYLGTLKYVTPELLPNLKAGAAFYINGDTGLTNWENDKKDAQGMFTDVNGKTNTLLGQAYIEYKNNMLHAKVGRQTLDTPLTKIQASLMPNFYEAAVASVTAIPDITLSLAHVSKISYGSRAATDATLIGEKTWTAGVGQLVVGQGAGTLEQATFHNIGTAAGVAQTNGINAIGATYTGVKDLKVSAWYYNADDIANIIYSDIDYKIPAMKGTTLSVSAQYLSQSETGSKLAGNLDYKMYGLKANLGNKKWSVYAAYNNSANKGKFLNPWGADPAYTSSLFSRNAYRQDVSAYKIGAHYVIMKGLKLVVSHADYGKSKTLGWANQAAVTDATETDIILAYKPTKALTLKIFNAIRTSEYNVATTAANTREMNHFRVVGWYDF